jgi:predicted phage-related endonuclease
MANDRSEFAPEVRNSAWWSGDTRLAVSGRANEAILQKLGRMERPDLSGVESVQMGHVMQPVIGRLAQDRLRMELKEADYSLTHPKEKWLKSHFDFISADGKVLVEAKNYGSHQRNKFDSELNIVPAADLAQCIHEATVHNVNRVVLAVLFGGNEFQTFDIEVTESDKEQLIQDMAAYWACVVAQNPLPAETVDQARLLYTRETATAVYANEQVEKIAHELKAVKAQIKNMEEHEATLQSALMAFMGNNSEILRVDGSVVATWRAPKASKKFDARLFQSAMPDIYQQFVVEAPSARRFLVK